MSGVRINVNLALHAIFPLILVSNLFPIAQCADGDDYSRTGNPAMLPPVTQLIYGRLSNLTGRLMDDLQSQMGFCIKNVHADWKGAVNFIGNLDFLTNCIKKTKACPLGSYCPLAKLNNATGICDPYSYKVPSGQPNHTCGTADIWSNVEISTDIFCSPGSYCPTTTSKLSCSSGY
ncbi:hypothetical protein LWI29_000441 [Acer saccharum]|uniref:Uncharacterized protein n=1 Tax=Acer saccharum TaxID=4024 RepID=A0AA39RY87_ACESA|nr:hypothetical protein LWI29_000441 [Acer saccharum]